MNTDDYAIVVGIARYPALGEGGTPLDLKGSENDLDAIVAWLTDANGGNMLQSNIQIVRSSAFPAPTSATDARPTGDDLEMTLVGLDQIAQSNRNQGKGQTVGRRLYIYMSGHGFSPDRNKGCLFTANAMERLSLNVHASRWLEWFQDAGYFREFVLWMDCCMDRVSFLKPRDPTLPLVSVSTPPEATFIAFAAQRPLRTVETAIPEDGGRVHGVFTWALLEGLRGAAVDANGRVTGRSLADWLRNAQAARLSEGDRKDRTVAMEPEIVQGDSDLIFARGVPARTYPVSMRFPNGAAGRKAQIWSGAPPRIEEEIDIANGPIEVVLRPGFYLVDVPDIGLRQGFEVVGKTEVDIVEHGDPVALPGEDKMFTLTIEPNDPTAGIFVIDTRFSMVDRYTGRLQTPLPFGLFKIKIRIGRSIKEQIILLDRDSGAGSAPEIVPQLATVAPLRDTAASHEYQEGASTSATQVLYECGRAGSKAALTVMARVYSGPDRALPDAQPWEGVRVVDARGKVVLDLAKDGKRGTEGDPFAVHTIPITPGIYFLQQQLDGGILIEQSLVIVEKWGLEVYILRHVAPSTNRLDPRPRLSLLMRKLSQPSKEDQEDRLIETARVALADERCILNPEIEELLLMKCRNPMAGIMGGHLLLIEHERNPGQDLRLLNEVVKNLRNFVGSDHPDVEALSLRCPDLALRRTQPVEIPPMFQRSWKLLVEASLDQPKLVPRAVWRRVEAQSNLRPFLVWTADEAIKTVSRRELARATWGLVAQEKPVPEPAAIVNTVRASDLTLPVAAMAGVARGLTDETSMAKTAPAAMAMELPATQPSPSPQRPRRVDRKLARERALRLQIPASALDLLAKEYAMESKD